MKAKEKPGYLFTYVADVTQNEIDFARLQQIKLATNLSVYSNDANHSRIDETLSQMNNWPDDNEIKWLKWRFVKVEPIVGILKHIRKVSYWTVEKSANDNKSEEYICGTTYNYLKFLSIKYGLKGLKVDDKYFITNKFEIKHHLLTKHPSGHKIEFIHDSKLIPKKGTKTVTKRKTIEPLVCITDGTTVSRIVKSEAEKLIKNFPTMKFCSKIEYKKWLHQFDTKTPKFSKANKVPVLTKQGAKNDPNNTKDRRSRRLILQKKKLGSRLYSRQRITGHWIDDSSDSNYQVWEETTPKTIIVRRSEPSYKPRFKYSVKPKMSRLVPHKFNKIESDAKRMIITKFPYNKPIVVNYTKKDKDDVIQHIKEDNCLMMNNKIIKYDKEMKEQIVLCSIKDVETWANQEDYKPDKDGKINPEIWHKVATVESYTKTKFERIPFHLPIKNKKTKQWRHPIKEPKYVGRKRRNAKVA